MNDDVSGLSARGDGPLRRIQSARVGDNNVARAGLLGLEGEDVDLAGASHTGRSRRA